MLHRVKKENDMHEGKWNGLGGKFEAGESPEDCVIREILEESGLMIANPKLKGFITFPLFDGRDDWYVFLFVAEEFSGELIDSPEGNLEWIPDEKVTELPLWDGDKIFLSWLKGQKFFSAKFVYTDGAYIRHEVEFY
jgi:8-oxo-dGTP diphosphatase